jgi:gas vesicle protein
MEHKSKNYISAFILGGIAGGVLTLLYTPINGKKFREHLNSNVDNYLRIAKQKEEEIINHAKAVSDDIKTKTKLVSAFIDKYAGEVFDESRGRLEVEIASLKTGIKAAIETYKNGNAHSNKDRMQGEMGDELFSNYDSVVLPKNYSRK